MGFSSKQMNALRRNLNDAHVRTRRVQGRDLSYIEGWHAIAEANRIFGFDRWDRETVESRCVLAREARGSLHAVYVAKVRITVRAAGEAIIREGYGTGEARGEGSVGEAHERALKTAETDATKRALATFGRPFGLGLYLSARKVAEPRRGGYDPNAATPILDHERRRTFQQLGPNGRYHVPRRSRAPIDPALQSSSLNDGGGNTIGAQPSDGHERRAGTYPAMAATVARETAAGLVGTSLSFAVEPAQGLGNGPTGKSSVFAATTEPKALTNGDLPETRSSPLQPTATVASSAAEIKHGRLLIERTTHRREPAHLKFVAAQPCLICGRTPSDAHHLRFAQPRALGRKVSDEFTVPLCRVHHRQLHQSGNEVRWWEAIDRDVDPLEIAKGLWEQSQDRRRSFQPASVSGDEPSG